VKVAVCVPCRDQVCAGFSFDLANMVGFHAAAGMNIGLYQSPGTLIADQRVNLAKEAISQGATDILWIDSDMRFPKNALQRLLAHNKTIVAANYATRRIPVETTALNMVEGKWVHVPTRKDSTGLEQVTACGMGLMLTSAEVFKSLADPWFHIGYSTKNGIFLGEDVSMCMHAAKVGHPTFIDHDISKEIRHIGTLEYALEHSEICDGA
jgi:hypothetical protein